MFCEAFPTPSRSIFRLGEREEDPEEDDDADDNSDDDEGESVGGDPGEHLGQDFGGGLEVVLGVAELENVFYDYLTTLNSTRRIQADGMEKFETLASS